MSMRISAARVVKRATKGTSRLSVAQARRTANAPPMIARVVPSASSWRKSRPRQAPNAVRIDISRPRPARRASPRLATLAQTISNRKPVMPMSTRSRVRAPLTSRSRSGTASLWIEPATS